jgi:hypothetical protein
MISSTWRFPEAKKKGWGGRQKRKIIFVSNSGVIKMETTH